VPIEPQRDQIVHLNVTAGTAGWPIVSPFREHYLVPWDDGRVAIGATRESAGFTPHTTVAGLQKVFSEAVRVAPGLADASFREARIGLRPLSLDGLPVLGTVPDIEDAFVATGHGPTGLQLGPYSGKLVADVVRGTEPAFDLTPFAVDRF
jgi:D-amino-acid dehydrogenase